MAVVYPSAGRSGWVDDERGETLVEPPGEISVCLRRYRLR